MSGFISTKFLRGLISVLVFFLATVVEAHGGVDDGDDPPAATTPTKVTAQGNVALGFGLTAFAAFFAVIGAALPFLDLLIPRISPAYASFSIATAKPFISTLLSFSAGVLVFLALGDLYPEAVGGWRKAGFVAKQHGAIIVWAIMFLTFLCLWGLKIWRDRKNQQCGCHAGAATAFDKNPLTQPQSRDLEKAEVVTDGLSSTPLHATSPASATATTPTTTAAATQAASQAVRAAEMKEEDETKERERMRRLGINVAIALMIHNFPEGLSTFTVALGAPRIGAIYAIALAMHKIPEGLMVVLPIYAATKSIWKAFLFASIVGMATQLLGAVFGYLLFVTYWNEAVSGTLFAIVVAFLVWVVFGAMIPLAKFYDPAGRYVLPGVAGGVLFFGLVNALFAYA